MKRFLRILNRLRLRLGLFRWKNYAWIHTYKSEGRPTLYGVSWVKEHIGLSNLPTRADALYHIKRGVRRGERP